MHLRRNLYCDTTSYEYHQSVIDNARAAEKASYGRPLAIALDTVSDFLAEAPNFAEKYRRKDPRSVLV